MPMGVGVGDTSNKYTQLKFVEMCHLLAGQVEVWEKFLPKIYYFIRKIMSVSIWAELRRNVGADMRSCPA